MSPRDEILARLRTSRGVTVSLPNVRPPAMPSGDPVALFVERAVAVGVQVIQEAPHTWAASALGELHQRRVRSVAVWDDPALSPLTSALQAGGIEAVLPDQQTRDRLAVVDAGITSADAAIALSGTLVLACDPRRPRSTSLLPPLHIAVLSAHRIVPTLSHLFRDGSRSLPSALTFITGPSRTADIELTPVMGAHGPTEVIAYLIMEGR